jgi:DNA-binding XRE family transcriptional regulator
MFEKLRKLRTEHGASADKMAKLLGLETFAAYYKKESGAVKFSLIEAKTIADFFEMSMEEVFFAQELSDMDIQTKLQEAQDNGNGEPATSVE